MHQTDQKTLEPSRQRGMPDRLRIAIAHNRYQQAGGEDKVVAAEAAMLRRHGHTVEMLEFDNEAITGTSARLLAAAASVFSPSSYRRVGEALTSFRPHVLHVHNFQPTLSPAVFFAAGQVNVPVVQTLHNYRLLCANAQLFRDGQTCELCVQKRSFWPGVQHGCYRNSRLGGAVVGGAIALHAGLGTWNGRIARYIALSRFAAEKFGKFRLPAEKIRIKPNFVPDRFLGWDTREPKGAYALFVGRLSEEKGLAVLMKADRLGTLPLPLWIVGDGPMRDAVTQACAREGSRLRYLGPKSEGEVRALMQAAAVLVAPSLWYEGFPMVMVEAFSLGLPVIVSRLGGLAEIVEEGRSGLLFSAGDTRALFDTLIHFSTMETQQRRSMCEAVRSRYLERYGEETNYKMLLDIYGEILIAESHC